MKLRYYLRGLGIGILVTAAILCVTKSPEETLSDAQVRERATALGMVDSSSLVLSEIRKDSNSNKNDDISADEETVESSEESVELSEEPEESSEVSSVLFRIAAGASSDRVSRDLYEAGLVADAGEFDDYLCSGGYARSIRVGTYEITPGTEEEEIAKIITGKR